VKRLVEAEEWAGMASTVHAVWDDGPYGGVTAQQRFDEMLASGRAKPGDTFLAIGWLPPGGSGEGRPGPMSQ
jgi:hypothetical protein